MAKDIIEIVKDKIHSSIESLGLEIVDVEIKQDGKTRRLNLNIYIYSPDGVTVNDCVTVNNEITYDIDEIEYFKDKSYNLNISSPGLDRPLVKAKDFERNLNKDVKVEYVKNGEAYKMHGRIDKIDEEYVLINDGENNQKLGYDEIKKAKIDIKF